MYLFASNAVDPMRKAWSAIFSRLMLMPPPCIILRASPLLGKMPVSNRKDTISIPAWMDELWIVWTGTPSMALSKSFSLNSCRLISSFLPNNCAVVCCAEMHSSSPWTKLVMAEASFFCRILAPGSTACSASSDSISALGSRVKILIHFSASVSAALSQNW